MIIGIAIAVAKTAEVVSAPPPSGGLTNWDDIPGHWDDLPGTFDNPLNE